MKKSLLPLVVLLLLPAMALLATGGQEKTTGPVTLTLWYPAGEITVTTLPFREGPDPFAAFEAQSNVKIERVAIDYNTMQQKIFTALAGGVPPDIGFIDGSWMSGYIKDDALVQIPAADAKEWLSAVSHDIVVLSDWGGGKMYGYPSWGIDAYGITWNKTMFQQVGLNPDQPPKYWADFREDSKKLAIANPDGTLQRVGYAIRHLGQPHGIVDKWNWLLWGSGMKFISNHDALTGGTCTFVLPDTIKGLQVAQDMIYVDHSTSLDFPDPRDAFLKGIAAMQISEVISIQVRAPREAPDLKWAFAPPPAMSAGHDPAVDIAAWNLSVFSKTKYKDQALAAIKWYDSAENDYEQAKKYNSTPRYKVNWDKEPFSTATYPMQFKTMLPYAYVYPRTLALNGILDAVGEAIQKILNDKAPVEQALAEAQTKANAAVQAIGK
jgi:ABC-type glycerol-3-phosphate transport system substrate-binding protein